MGLPNAPHPNPRNNPQMTTTMKSTTYPAAPTHRAWRLALLAAALVLLQSCYHVRFVNKSGVPEPDPGNMAVDWYRGKQVDTIDTVIKVGLLNHDVMFLQDCPNGFFSLEYRVRLGDAMHNALTFGRKRRVHVKCVCMKETN